MPRFDKYKARAAMSFLTQKAGGKYDFYSVVKLLYLADKKHLYKTGRTITGDRFYRLKYGGTGTETFDLLKAARGDQNQSPDLREFIANSLVVEGSKPHYSVRLLQDPELTELSVLEQETLTEIWNEFKDKSFEELHQAALDHAYRLRPPGARSEITYEDLADEDASLREFLSFLCSEASASCGA